MDMAKLIVPVLVLTLGVVAYRSQAVRRLSDRLIFAGLEDTSHFKSNPVDV
jgi:hypothetical protein